MKKGILFCATFLVGALLLAGCSGKSMNPFAAKSQLSVQKDEVKRLSEKPAKGDQEKVDIDRVVVQMVNETRAGFFDKAISIGESAFEQGRQSEKFLDTLAVAYGYKNQLEGLTDREKKKYVETARLLLATDPTNTGKKNLLAAVLIDTGNFNEGNKLAAEIYNALPQKTKEVMDTYGWGLYRAGKAKEALPVFQALMQAGPDNLSQTYHTAVVLETVDKAKALSLYKKIVDWANNALTWEENRDNLASTALINKIRKDAQDAINRIQLRGRSAY
ncbi:hypothetical protein Tfer_2917 [Thermincola ferriacetica]|uniref:Tetratricopeptide repeat protein n=1 Tax=Thermincola ferriacetica TaxID=281456 RepID=A0A0L6W0B7_9FIRM|nr:hypothetical protein [Thermincola ferriacetica]KNZ68524.1 hypothetical protein Tfer_2917 [Thermincola ferriacetica]